MPLAVYGAATGVINGKLYVAGGQADAINGNNVATLQIYDPASNTWTTGAPLPQARSAADAGVIGGKLDASKNLANSPPF
jgi:N-acetylneuraminic acid mutarotase